MKSKIKYINSKNAAIVTLIVIVTTIVGVWLFGIGKNDSLYENSIISTSILSLLFFIFISFSLYNGMSIVDNVGDLREKINSGHLKNIPSLDGGLNIPTIDDGGIGGILLGVLFWILAAIVISIFVWVFSYALWALTLGFAAMLYWVFFRALRLVFYHSDECEGQLLKSISYGLFYTLLYNFWIYGLFFLLDNLALI